jgi:hypothetical protein
MVLHTQSSRVDLICYLTARPGVLIQNEQSPLPLGKTQGVSVIFSEGLSRLSASGSVRGAGYFHQGLEPGPCDESLLSGFQPGRVSIVRPLQVIEILRPTPLRNYCGCPNTDRWRLFWRSPTTLFLLRDLSIEPFGRAQVAGRWEPVCGLAAPILSGFTILNRIGALVIVFTIRLAVASCLTI